MIKVKITQHCPEFCVNRIKMGLTDFTDTDEKFQLRSRFRL